MKNHILIWPINSEFNKKQQQTKKFTSIMILRFRLLGLAMAQFFSPNKFYMLEYPVLFGYCDSMVQCFVIKSSVLY